VTADLILSPLLARKLITGGKISAAVGRRIVDLLFDGIGTHTSQSSARI
jgi:hypothetical protein